ncbi:MAG: asparagine synthase (glutamine-hydrolyzing) [Planctomycetes bacterium]|nr:asparagine synthase (glutamine-hydrolyzing) [Planctomycetota bacterium]
MCGIAGVFHADGAKPADEALLQRVIATLHHRGPDGRGVRARPGYGLAHARLSIVDLAAGAQPMGHDGTWVTFNGEIYNFLDLRRELEALGYTFETRCDTEVLVHGWRAWGERLPERLRGMFAFAIVDERDRTLFLARDRMGKKPLYWHRTAAGDLWFASELKALRAVPELRAPELDRRALGEFFCLRYVPDPRTIYRDVHKLPPATCMTVRDGRPAQRRYWTLSFATEELRDERELHEAVLHKLDESTRIRLMGDVPLGAFLSGGIDSFAVVDSMARVGTGEVVACTMGFEGGGPLDERQYAREAARACGATLHEDAIGPDDMLEQGWFDTTYDEPMSDESAIPTYHVSRLARRHVTVALSGDGGDESFAGYRRHKFDALENRLRGRLPRGMWAALGALYPKLDFMPRWMRFKRTFQNMARRPGEAYARSVSAVLPEELRPLLRPAWAEAGADPLAAVREAYEAGDGEHPLARCAAADFATYLPGDILVKVDRASMAVSLEVRAPFLDQELVELAARVPASLKLAGGRTKGFLRRALRGRLGDEALDRPKQGFSPPSRAWLRGAVGDALERAFDDERLTAILDTARLRPLLREHRAGLRDHTTILWATSVLHRFLARWT